MIIVYKIAILGCENSHADGFLDFIKDDAEFADVEVVGVYSNDDEAADRVSQKYGVYKMKSFDEFVGKLDGVVVTARHGDNHYKYAEPYFESGIPFFMDKPVTINPEESVKMMEAFKKYGNRFSGGSVLKYAEGVLKLKKIVAESADKTISGYVKAPIMMNSEYGGFYFYAQHLVEMVCEIFGRYPQSVTACRNEDTVTTVFRYADYDITGVFTEGSFTYYAYRIGAETADGGEVTIDSKHFREEFYHFYESLKGEGESPDADEFIAPVYIMNAIEKALESGKEEKVMA